MPKLQMFSGRQPSGNLLALHGYDKVRQKGSHIIMQKLQGKTAITIPVPDYEGVKTGTLLSIIRQTGLPHALV